jgi:hypothetical protein
MNYFPFPDVGTSDNIDDNIPVSSKHPQKELVNLPMKSTTGMVMFTAFIFLQECTMIVQNVAYICWVIKFIRSCVLAFIIHML